MGGGGFAPEDFSASDFAACCCGFGSDVCWGLGSGLDSDFCCGFNSVFASATGFGGGGTGFGCGGGTGFASAFCTGGGGFGFSISGFCFSAASFFFGCGFSWGFGFGGGFASGGGSVTSSIGISVAVSIFVGGSGSRKLRPRSAQTCSARLKTSSFGNRLYRRHAASDPPLIRSCGGRAAPALSKEENRKPWSQLRKTSKSADERRGPFLQ